MHIKIEESWKEVSQQKHEKAAAKKEKILENSNKIRSGKIGEATNKQIIEEECSITYSDLQTIFIDPAPLIEYQHA
jgi:hypothetical protein